MATYTKAKTKDTTNAFTASLWLNVALIGIFCVFNSFSGLAQENLNKDLIEFSDVNLSSKWDIKIINNTTIEYAFTDSLDLCFAQDLSPVKDYCSDTLTEETFKLILRFEENWSVKRIHETQEENDKKESQIRERILTYGDSLDWKFMKANRQLVINRPLDYVRIVHNWPADELALISSIEKIPHGVHKGHGVFVEVNAGYVNPRRKLVEIEQLFITLEKKGLKFFWKFLVSDHVDVTDDF